MHCDPCDMYRWHTNNCSQIFTRGRVFIGYCGALSLGYWDPVTPDVSMLPTGVHYHWQLRRWPTTDMISTVCANVFPTVHESDTGHIPTHSWSHTMTYRCLIALNQATNVTITCLLWPLEAMTMQVNTLYYCAHCDSCDNADYIPVPVVKYSLGNVFFIGYCSALSLGLYWGPVTPDVSMLPTSMYCHSSVDMI